MRAEFIFVLVAAIFVFDEAQASTLPCKETPQIAEYVAADSRWRPLLLSDLGTEDQSLWTRAHGKQCPGMVQVKMGRGRDFTAVALIKREQGKLFEKVVLIPKNPAQAIVLSPESQTAIPHVISRVRPGRYLNRLDEKLTSLKYDGVLYEQIEAGAIVLYLDKTEVRAIVVSE